MGGSRPPMSGQGNRRPPNGRYVDQTRINDRIRSPKVRVVDGITHQQYGVLVTSVALRMARERGLDLVEVAATADPPVCKIIDYGKYKYSLEKQKKEAHKHQKGGKVKEMKFRIGIDPHDYKIKITHAEDFLAEGHKVRLQLQFRGRQMAHQELGHALAARIKADLLTMGHPDQEPKMAGRNINMQISPLPERQRHRKFRAHLKGVTDQKDILHAEGHDPRENLHSEEDHHDDDHHHEPVASPEVATAPAVEPTQTPKATESSPLAVDESTPPAAKSV